MKTYENNPLHLSNISDAKLEIPAVKKSEEATLEESESSRKDRILALILNWNGKALTLECLESLSRVTSTAFTTLVVDNGSRDDSVAAIRAAFPHVEILETGENLGYAGGNNAGFRWALEKGFDWVLVLNNDLVVAPDLLEQFLKAADEHPQAGILGAKVYNFTHRNRLESFGGFWSDEKAEWVSAVANDETISQVSQKVDAVMGCAMLVKRAVFETIGFFEEKFFLIFEETDFCARATRKNFAIWTVSEAKVWHKGSASFYGGKRHHKYFWWRNRLLWISRNCSLEKQKFLYRSVLWKEMFKCAKGAILRSTQNGVRRLFRLSISASQRVKAETYRAGLRGIFDYFCGRFGNCPLSYRTTHTIRKK